MDDTRLSKATVWQGIKRLKAAGFLRTEKKGRRVYYFPIGLNTKPIEPETVQQLNHNGLNTKPETVQQLNLPPGPPLKEEPEKEKHTKKTGVAKADRFRDDSYPVVASRRLFNEVVKKVYPKKKTPAWQLWAKSIDQMIAKDDFTEDEITSIIDYLIGLEIPDDKRIFSWKTVIQSTVKLRVKRDDLLLAAQREVNHQPRASQPAQPQDRHAEEKRIAAEAERWYRQPAAERGPPPHIPAWARNAVDWQVRSEINRVRNGG